MNHFKNIKIEIIILIGIIIGGVIWRLYFWFSFGDFTWDEGSHSLAGVLLARTITHGFSLEYFKEFSNHYWASIGSLFFFPWGYTILTTISYLIFGFSDFSARLPSMLFSILSIYSIYLLAQKIFNQQVALISAFLLAINPYFTTLGGVALVDMPMTCLMLLAFYFCLLALDDNKTKHWLLSGLFIGLAGLMKPTGFIIFPFLLMVTLYNRGLVFLISKKFLFFNLFIIISFISYFGLGLLALLVFPKFGWISLAEGQVIFKSIFQWFGRILPEKYFHTFGQDLIYANFGDPNWQSLKGWLFYLQLIPKQLGSILLVATSAIGTLFLISRHQKKALILSGLYVIYIYLIFTFIANKDSRYTLPMLPFLIMLSAVGINYLGQIIRSKYTGFLALSFSLLLIAYFSFGAITNANFNNIGHNLQTSTAAITSLAPGSIMPFQENNIINVQTISFYAAINDPELQFTVYWPEADHIADYVMAQTESEIKGFKVILLNHQFQLLPNNFLVSNYK